IAEYELCKKLNPDHIEARFLFSTVYFRAGMLEKAIEELEPIIPKASDSMKETFTTVLNEYKRFLEVSQKAQKTKK
ncbi:MAG: tetratricopeptide repeat protein, partial [Sedimentisphaerales bacterium]|nr:tetratricopeptide repeat protein [Sedimentisphaerales bacterium]